MSEKIMVRNRAGKELDFTAAYELMNKDIVERFGFQLWNSEQEYFTAYEDAHEEMYGEEWELSKANPVW